MFVFRYFSSCFDEDPGRPSHLLTFLNLHVILVDKKNSFLSLLLPGGLLHPEAVQRWSIEQIRSCAWLSNETFLKEHDPFPLNLTQFWTSVNKDLKKSDSISDSIRTTSSFEDEAHSQLEDLGITSELLQTTTNNSTRSLTNRDSINGTYRIILHRLQKQSTAIERDDPLEKVSNEDLAASWGRSMSVHGDPSERNETIGKPTSMSYGGTTARPHRNSLRTHQSRKRNLELIQHHQQTKVCSIL